MNCFWYYRVWNCIIFWYKHTCWYYFYRNIN